MAKSFKQMRNEGITKRAEGAQIDINDVHFDPTLNAVGRNEEHDEDDEDLFQFIMSGRFDQLPAWEVRPREEGGVWVVEGHRRTIQVRRAIAAGAPLADAAGKVWIPIKQFVGNDIDRIVRVGTSARKKPLKPHQFADLFARLRGFNKTPAEIATLMCCSRSKVEQALVLTTANNDVQQAVQSGTISATEAVKQVRIHGEKAGAVIKEAVAKAAPAKEGAPKVTAAAFVMPTPSPRTEALRKALNEAHAMLAPLVDGGSLDNADVRRLQGIVATGLRLGAAA